jgi:N-acetylmuramoyl-L-alanine amidase
LPSFPGKCTNPQLGGAIVASIVALSLASMSLGHAAPAEDPAKDTSSASKPASSKCDRSKFRTILDVGHTAKSPGAASSRNIDEFEFNLRLAKRIQEKLKADGFSETTVLVTEGKAKPSLMKRVAAANKANPDLLLSIHHDSVPDGFLEDWEFEGKPRHFSDKFSGYSVFVSEQNPHYKASLMFAKMLGNQMAARDQQFARQYDQMFMGKYQRLLLDIDAGVYRYDELIVLRKTQMPAVLLEAGSIINRDEELLMASAEYHDLVSAAVSSAVAEFCDAHTPAQPRVAQPQISQPQVSRPKPQVSRRSARKR